MPTPLGGVPASRYPVYILDGSAAGVVRSASTQPGSDLTSNFASGGVVVVASAVVAQSKRVAAVFMFTIDFF